MKIRIHVFYSLILIVSSTVPLISFSLVWLLSQLVGKVKKKIPNAKILVFSTPNTHTQKKKIFQDVSNAK